MILPKIKIPKIKWPWSFDIPPPPEHLTLEELDLWLWFVQAEF